MATATKEVFLGEFNVGSVDRIRATITKDGETWDLSGGSASLRFEAPDRATQFDRAMVAESDGSDGVFVYDTEIADIDQAGYWTLRLKVVDGAVVKVYPYEISLHAVDEP